MNRQIPARQLLRLNPDFASATIPTSSEARGQATTESSTPRQSSRSY
jgi:hypothetical protein